MDNSTITLFSSGGILTLIIVLFRFNFTRIRNIESDLKKEIKSLEDDMKDKADKIDMNRGFDKGEAQFKEIQTTLTDMHGILSSVSTKVDGIKEGIKNNA